MPITPLHIRSRRLSLSRGCIGAALFTSLIAPGSAAAKLTTVATYPLPGTVAAGHGWVAVTQATEVGATLLVGREGAVPQPVAAASSVPSFAQPHVGTDVHGHAVIVYPTCTAEDCDLKLLDPERGTVRSAHGANRASADEVEGDMDRGALAFSIVRGHRRPSITSIDQPKMDLAYRPTGGQARVLTRLGGSEIELDRGRALSVRHSYGEGSGDCGISSLVLTTVSGRRSVIAQVACGMDGQHITGTGFIGKRRVAWGVTTLGGSVYRQLDLVPGARRKEVRAVGGFISYAPLNSRSAVVLQGLDPLLFDPADVEPGEAPEFFPLVHVTGIVVGAKDASDQRR